MTDATPDRGSLQAQLRQARAKAQTAHTIDLEIPGYDGTLWVTFRALDDYKDVSAINRKHERVADEDDRNLLAGADVLIAACEDVFVPEDGFQADKPGHRHSLGMKFGAELAEFLGVAPKTKEGDDIPLTDTAAVFLIFPNTLQLASVAAQVNLHTANAGTAADREAQGN